MRQKITYSLQKMFLFFLFAIAFLLPFQPKFLATVEIITIIVFFLAYSPATVFKNIKQNKLFIPFFLFFIITVISYFFSEDKVEAKRLVEVKLPFFIIPLLILGSGADKKVAKTGMICFLAGCAAACFVLLGWSTYDYIKTQDSNVFFYTELSRFMHVSYFSLYLLICFGWFFMLALEDQLLFPKTHYFLMAIFALCIFLISAKMVLITALLSSLLFVIYYVRRKKKILTAIIFMGIVLALPILLYFTSSNIQLRVDNFASELSERNKPQWQQNMGSTATRIIIWKEAWPRIKQNLPTGVGIGDVQPMLQEIFKERNMKVAAEKKFNMHNEYLQQLAGSGIAGFLCWIIILLLPIFICKPPYRFIGILFSFSTIMVSLTESILERQAGTIFICLVGLFLMVAYGKNEKPSIHA